MSRRHENGAGPLTSPSGRARAAALALACIIAIAIAAGLVFVNTGGRSLRSVALGLVNDAGSIVLSQLVVLADRSLVPDLACENTAFEAPGTVRLIGLSLNAPDGQEVLRLEELELTLLEMPRRGQPLAIERIAIRDGTLRLIEAEDGGLIGLSPLLKPRRIGASGATPETSVEDDTEYALSDLLKIRQIEVTGMTVEYQPAGGQDAMRLTGLASTLALVPRPETASGDGAVRYDLTARIDRSPELDLSISASLDDGLSGLRDLRLESTLELDEGRRERLTPTIRRLLDTYRVNGRAQLSASAPELRFDNIGGLRATAALRVNDARAQIGDRRVLAERLAVDLTVRGKVLESASLDASVYEGSFSARATTPDGTTASAWTWTASDLNLQSVLTQPGEGPPRLAGRLSGDGTLTLDPADPSGTLGGTGRVAVRDGRFVAIPVFTQLANAMQVAGPFGEAVSLNQRLDATFSLHPDRVELTSSEATTSVFAARATGDIGFDGSLDLRANGGPLEKVQSMLGIVGDAIGALTDRIVTYRIRGSVEEPTVSVQPLGIGG